MSNKSYLANENVSPTFVAVAKDHNISIIDAKVVYGQGTDDVEDILTHSRDTGAVIITADRRIKQHINAHDIEHNGVIRVGDSSYLKQNPEEAVQRLLSFDKQMNDTTRHLSYLTDWAPFDMG